MTMMTVPEFLQTHDRDLADLDRVDDQEREGLAQLVQKFKASTGKDDRGRITYHPCCVDTSDMSGLPPSEGIAPHRP